MPWSQKLFSYLFYYSIIASSSCQYISVQKPNKLTCDDSKTSLVEYFFNVIFTEFQNSPPVCVCVQMCVGQPVYCYPNGCHNKDETQRKNDHERPPATQAHDSDTSKTMFIVGDGNDLTHAFHNKEEPRVQRQKSITREFFSDPLKDMYRTLFKYKKIPSLELRYNLREQVKNMKSDKLKMETATISKRRWPKLYQNSLYGSNNNDGYSQIITQSIPPEKFMTMNSNPEENQRSIVSKYFKRDLRRNGYFDKAHTSDIEEIADVTPKRFSIETLIKNIMGNNFDEENISSIEFKVAYNNVNNNDNESLQNYKEKCDSNNNNNDIAFVSSKNTSNAKNDSSKYNIGDTNTKEKIENWSNYTLNEIIAALSKKIELQNNSGTDMWKNKASLKEDGLIITQKPLNNDKTDKVEDYSNLVIDQSSAKNTTNSE